MPDDKDYRSTLNLPKTDFPMRANLGELEPRMQKFWEEIDLYGSTRRAAEASRSSSCTMARRSPMATFT